MTDRCRIKPPQIWHVKPSKTFQNLVEFYFREKILSLSKGQFYNIFKVSMPQYISVALEPKINL